MARIARAQWRPLPQNATARVIKPRLIIVHTQVGYLGGTEAWFKNPRAGGVESTFGIGGPWDGPDVDGDIYQWMDTHRQADCNLNANGISASIEMADGGKPTRPFSPKQIAALTALIVDLCRAENIPPTLARRWDGSGLGYHQQFIPQWDRNHDCPGTVRRTQLLKTVFPAVAAALKPKEPNVAVNNLRVPRSASGHQWPWGDYFDEYNQPIQQAINVIVPGLQQELADAKKAMDALTERVANLENGAPK